jgi:hypothetical protein
MGNDNQFGVERNLGYPVHTQFLPAFVYLLAAIVIVAIARGAGV